MCYTGLPLANWEMTCKLVSNRKEKFLKEKKFEKFFQYLTKQKFANFSTVVI